MQQRHELTELRAVLAAAWRDINIKRMLGQSSKTNSKIKAKSVVQITVFSELRVGRGVGYSGGDLEKFRCSDFTVCKATGCVLKNIRNTSGKLYVY